VATNDDKLRRQLGRELSPYLELLTAFTSARISADEFESKFLAMYADDPRFAPKDVFKIFDAFFADVDAYVSDPRLRDPANGDLGPDELRERARALLRQTGYDV
jgi:hypothetical protein